MSIRMSTLLLAVFLIFTSTIVYAQEAKSENETPSEKAAADPPKPELDPGVKQAYDLIKNGLNAVTKIKTATYTFYKQEYKGKVLPQEIANAKFRKSPHSVYMKWIGSEKKNQEVIWSKDWNDNKIRAHKGSFPDVTVNLKTDSWMAMKDNRHPITEAGFEHTVKLIARDMKLAVDHPDWGVKVKYLGEKKMHGVASTCYEAEMDKSKYPRFYGYKAMICADKKSGLPNKVKIWDKEDGKIRLVEDYGYENIRVNVKLTDADFDPENKEYGF